jgi:hypothetical protein
MNHYRIILKIIYVKTVIDFSLIDLKFYPDNGVQFCHRHLFRPFNRCGHLLLMLDTLKNKKQKK